MAHPVIDSFGLPPASLELRQNELHVWRVSVDRSPDELDRLATTLDEDELARAQRFRFEMDRRHFIARRGILREILAAYLNRRAAELRYRLGSHGKPLLEEDSSPAVRFNLSHSADLALVAVARGCDVGVDVERVVPERADRKVARRFFAEGEIEALERLDDHDFVEAFFRCWTRKEAYIKARGEGLSFPLRQFEVSLGSDEPARIVRVEGDDEEARRWSMLAVHPGAGYAGAVVMEGSPAAVRSFAARSRFGA